MKLRYYGFITILYIHPKSFGTTLEILHFSEAVQVCLNPAPITQSIIKSQQNKNQPPLALSSTSTPHTLNYTTTFQEGQRRSFPFQYLHKKILKSAPPPHFLINTRNKKDKILVSTTILISFGNTYSKEMNSSTRQIGLTHETINWTVAHKSWMEGCSRHTLGFSRFSNLPKHYLQKTNCF